MGLTADLGLYNVNLSEVRGGGAWGCNALLFKRDL
jgi:hypothetical protein